MSPESPLFEVHIALRRARVVAEASASMVREMRGCQIDADDMIELFELIDRTCAEGLSLVAHAEKGGGA